MIKVEVNQEQNLKVYVAGTTIDIASELSAVIREVYSHLYESNKEEGERFANFMKIAFDALFLSENEMREKLKEDPSSARVKALEEVNRCLDELIKVLAES